MVGADPVGRPSGVAPTPTTRRWVPWAALAVSYGALSVALWWHVWSGHPAGTLTCLCGDPAQSVWFLGWVAHALAHGQDPLLSTAAAHPAGVNLLANQSSVLVGVVLAPVTWLFGPVATLNTALTAAPALDALAAAALCRRFTGWGPAAVGGLLFGFSPLVVSELGYAHLADTVLVFVPAIVLCLHELLVRRRGRPVRWGVALAAAVVGQYFVSAEMLAITAVVVLLVVAAVALAAGVSTGVRRLVGGGRPPGGSGRDPSPAATAGGLAVAGGLSVAALAWPAWFALAGPRHISGAVWAGTADLGAPWTSFFTVPSSATVVAFTHFGGYLGGALPEPAYLGPGLLAVLAAAVVVAWRRRELWVALVTLATAAVLSLGGLLLPFDWYSTWWLPWRLFGSLPVLQSVGPERLMAVGDLAAAVTVAVAVDTVTRRAAARRPAEPRHGDRSFVGHLAAALSPSDRPANRGDGGVPGGDGPGPGTRLGGSSLVDHLLPRVLVAPRRGAPPTGGSTTVAGRRRLAAVVAVGLAAGAVVPTLLTYPLPFTTSAARLPAWFERVAPSLPRGSVLLTLPFPTGRVSQAMAWQAVDGFRFDLAGAYAKLPGPTGQADYGGTPGSADWALSQLTEPTGPLPVPTATLAGRIRAALHHWQVTEVVAVARQVGAAYPAQYAVAFMTAVLGRPPRADDGAWVWTGLADLGPPLAVTTPVLDACLALAGHDRVPPDTVPDCVASAA